MGNLFSSLLSSAGAMRVYDRALNVVQNNVSNASTAGYAKQRMALDAMRFQPEAGFPGGVAAGQLESLRNGYAERAVWRQQGLSGKATQKADDLSRTEGLLPVGDGAGIPAALSNFFQSFSTLAVAPNNTVSRQAALDRANDAAATFRDTAESLSQASSDASRQIGDVIDRINHLGEEVRKINEERRWNAGTTNDAGLDARMHATIEDLAELVDVTALGQSDGSIMLLVGGQAPLVVGSTLRPISADVSGPDAVIKDSDGNDVTKTVNLGRLAGLLDTRNNILPGYQASLNRLAEGFADQVNGQLRQGIDSYGQTPVKDLFTYDTDLGIAVSLRVNDLQPEELAAADANAFGGNGNALGVASMATSQQVDGFTFAGFYGKLAAQAGRDVEGSKADQQTEEQLLSQSRTLREQISGVSLDEEAIQMMQFQRAYQASARLITVLDSLTETLINLLK